MSSRHRASRAKTLFAAALFIGLSPAAADASTAASSMSLKEKYGQLRARLEKNPFGRPLAIDSTEAGNVLRGDAYAVVAHPFARVRESMASAANWCEVLTLPFNVQKCVSEGDEVHVYIGRKPESPIEQATRLDLRFAVAQRGDDLLQVELSAPTGPAGTHDYRIQFAAVPIAGDRTLIHLGYGYATGMMARMAVQAYLATSGASKVGFSQDGEDENGKPRLVGGIRGVVERNTMRYFLAIEAFLDAHGKSDADRRRASLENWFRAVERYPRQLKEMTREKYLSLKLAPSA